MTQLDLVSPSRFAVLEDPEQEEAKMPDLDTAEPEEIAQDECLGNKAEERKHPVHQSDLVSEAGRE